MTAPHADERPLEALLDVALGADADRAWEAVDTLHYRGSVEVLEAARGLLEDSAPRARALGAVVLGQLGVPNRTFPDACLKALTGQLSIETVPEVIGEIGTALGHLNDARVVGPLVAIAAHADSRARFGVVLGLIGQQDEQAVTALIGLSADPDEEVRNWATYGLAAQTDQDGPALREALAARLEDDSMETRCEAIAGLAARHDERVIEATRKALEAGWVHPRLFEAATELAEPALRPALEALRPQIPARFEEALEEAIARSS